MRAATTATSIPMNHKARAVVWCALLELYTAPEARQWLNSPHPQLAGRKPTDCSYREVMAILDRLKSGAYV